MVLAQAAAAATLKRVLSRAELETLAAQMSDDELWRDDSVVVRRRINDLLASDAHSPLKATTTTTLQVLAPSTPMPAIDLTSAQTTIEIGYKVLSGLMADNYFANSSNCFARATNFTFVELPSYQYNLTAMLTLINAGTSDSTTVWNAYYSASVYSTRLIQNATNHLWVCNSLGSNVYKFGAGKAALFSDFTTMATAFFQNLLSKIISINNIYNSIQSKQQSGDTSGIYFDLARLVRILMDF